MCGSLFSFPGRACGAPRLLFLPGGGGGAPRLFSLPGRACGVPRLLLRILALPFLLMFMASCAVIHEGPIDPPQPDLQANLSPSLRQPCEEPVHLPDRELLLGEVVDGWNTDRAHLRECGAEKLAVIAQFDLITGRVAPPIPEPSPRRALLAGQ